MVDQRKKSEAELIREIMNHWPVIKRLAQRAQDGTCEPALSELHRALERDLQSISTTLASQWEVLIQTLLSLNSLVEILRQIYPAVCVNDSLPSTKTLWTDYLFYRDHEPLPRMTND